jgi:hypothetical protein
VIGPATGQNVLAKYLFLVAVGCCAAAAYHADYGYRMGSATRAQAIAAVAVLYIAWLLWTRLFGRRDQPPTPPSLSAQGAALTERDFARLDALDQEVRLPVERRTNEDGSPPVRGIDHASLVTPSPSAPVRRVSPARVFALVFLGVAGVLLTLQVVPPLVRTLALVLALGRGWGGAS